MPFDSPLPPDTDRALDRAVAALRAGGLVAVPTETVYGLAADAQNEAAVARIFAAKGRPRQHPLIVHIADARALDDWATQIPPAARLLADRFWPGPLTLVLPRSARVPLAVTGGLETVALRVPAHPLTLELLRRFGGGIAAPSANRFGAVSPTTAAHVQEDLGDAVDVILDGGPCSVGVESTIVDLSGEAPRVLRPGGLGREVIEAALGQSLGAADAGPEVRAPGNLPSHYAPRARVTLVEGADLTATAEALAAAGELVGVLLFGPLPPQSDGATAFPEGVQLLPLPAADDEEARALYAGLRELDRRGCDVILATLPPETGLGWAIADRLRKAAGPR